MDYQPRTDDAWFLIDQALQLPQRLRQLAPFAEVDDDLMRQVLEESGTFVGEVIAPLNLSAWAPRWAHATGATPSASPPVRPGWTGAES